MTLVSLTAFAATHGASRQAAAKWKKAGVLKFSGDLVDVEQSDERMRSAGLGRFKSEAAGAQPTPATTPRNRASVAPRNQGKVAPQVAAVIDEVVADFEAAAEDDEIDEEIATGFIEQLLAGQFRSKVEAVAIKENALALKHLLAAQKEASKLVEIEVAEAVIFDDRRAARDAWMAFPSRFAPLLAADLDIDGAMLAEALKPYVHQQLDELGEPDLDFSTNEG
ncbi:MULTISPECIES: hypothetical protein [Sphingomonas]|uniref:hypothetical protein n=1 Tax=Sphingomonas TaxID=13687 RepID=UPI00254E3BF0|nr:MULTISPECIES: hypothetical protein [Sphingomonas]MDK8187764.1 hypothetical protein [Sphingomonas zeae]MDK8217618.1 hypothetical protein [Sphingomonas sp. UMB7805-LC452B]